MNNDLSILLGLHEPELLKMVKISAEFERFSVYSASCLEEMRVLMREREYHGYLMDLNLKHDGHIIAVDITPAREIYALVRDRVQREEAAFLGFSGREETVRAALRENIPAEGKPFPIFTFLQQCRELKPK